MEFFKKPLSIDFCENMLHAKINVEYKVIMTVSNLIPKFEKFCNVQKLVGN